MTGPIDDLWMVKELIKTYRPLMAWSRDHAAEVKGLIADLKSLGAKINYLLASLPEGVMNADSLDTGSPADGGLLGPGPTTATYGGADVPTGLAEPRCSE